MADEIFAGPVNFVVFGFPNGVSVGSGLTEVLRRAESGIIGIVDIECIKIDSTGAVSPVDIKDFGLSGGFDASVFEGSNSGILGADDFALMAEGLDPDSIAIAIVYEDRSLASAASEWVKSGGWEHLMGGIDVEQLAAVVE